MYALLFTDKSLSLDEKHDIYDLGTGDDVILEGISVGVVCPLCNMLISEEYNTIETDDYTSLNLVINCNCGSFICCPTTKDDMSLYEVLTTKSGINCSKLIDVNEAEKINPNIRSIIVEYYKKFDSRDDDESDDDESDDDDSSDDDELSDSKIIEKYNIFKISICNVKTYGYTYQTFDMYMKKNKSLCYNYKYNDDDLTCIDVDMNTELFYKDVKLYRANEYVYYKSVCEQCNNHYEGELGSD